MEISKSVNDRRLNATVAAWSNTRIEEKKPEYGVIDGFDVRRPILG